MDNTRSFVSPLSGTTRTESLPGGKWAMSITVQNLKTNPVISNPLQELEAFLFRLNGKEHRAVINDFGYARTGPGGGSPVVVGGSQTGLSLDTGGWTADTTVLYAGDRIGVSSQMIPVVADVTSDNLGLATISLAHPIRTAPTHGVAIEIDAPTATYILSTKASFSMAPGIFKTVLVEFEEAIP